MKKFIFKAMVIFAAVLGVIGTAQADSVSGSGAAGTQYVYFSVSATSGPRGEGATGMVVLEDAGISYLAEVTLLCASGNKAVLSGAVITSAPWGYGFILHVQDNASTGTPDLVRWELVNYVPASCPAFSMNPPAEVTFGDIAVVDVVGDSVWGEGAAGTQYVFFAVSATSGPDGGSASGQAVLVDATGCYDAKVTLLCASGNNAVLSGAIIEGAPLGYGFILHVQDNASAGTPDLMRWELVNYVPATCPAFAIPPRRRADLRRHRGGRRGCAACRQRWGWD